MGFGRKQALITNWDVDQNVELGNIFKALQAFADFTPNRFLD
jgi:hypothetical protein